MSESVAREAALTEDIKMPGCQRAFVAYVKALDGLGWNVRAELLRMGEAFAKESYGRGYLAGGRHERGA